MEIRPVGAKFFHADRHDEANSRFRNFADTLKKPLFYVLKIYIVYKNTFLQCKSRPAGYKTL
jgi:hypothetical protein